LRSSLFSLVLFGALSGGLVIACASVEASALGERAGGDVPESADDASAGRATAGDPSPSLFGPIGSPLCAYYGDAANACLPDDDGRERDLACSAPDGGVPACRIKSGGPECTYGTASGVDGVACERREDCAAGFDCIRSSQGGVCRHYCCSGSCASVSSQNGGPTFCDVQEIFKTGGKAPICMPIKKCRLLTPGDCAAGETCAVVTEKGDTGCVAIGPATAGASCEEVHCAADLTCLGFPGNRRCYALCRIDRSTCASGEKCTTGTVFNEQTYGVCR
jgi:hypothetical protein